MPTTHLWEGDALAVAQVDTVQITAFDAATTYILTVGGKTVSCLGNTSVNQTATDLAAAWNASTDTVFAEVTATAATDTVTLTADTAGKPFVATSSVSGGAGTIGAVTSSTANAGPNVWAAANFNSGTLPANGDTVIFQNSNVSCLYNLDQNTVTLADLQLRQSFTGKLGLPRTNASGYLEYRDTYLKISATAFSVCEGEGNGSGRLKVDVGSNQTALTVYNQGTRAETGIPCLLVLGTHAGNTLDLLKGDVGAAFFGGESTTLVTINVSHKTNQAGDSSLVCGSGCTLTTLNVDGGSVDVRSNLTTVTQRAGTLTIGGAATVTTLNLRGGTCRYNSSGTLTTLNLNGGATLDFRQDPSSRTVTNANLYEGAKVYDPAARVTWTNGLDLVQCGLGDVTLDLGEHRTWTPSAI